MSCNKVIFSKLVWGKFWEIEKFIVKIVFAGGRVWPDSCLHDSCLFECFWNETRQIANQDMMSRSDFSKRNMIISASLSLPPTFWLMVLLVPDTGGRENNPTFCHNSSSGDGTKYWSWTLGELNVNVGTKSWPTLGQTWELETFKTSSQVIIILSSNKNFGELNLQLMTCWYLSNVIGLSLNKCILLLSV